jgi:hypothetical protein
MANEVYAEVNRQRYLPMLGEMTLGELPERIQSKIMPEPNSGCWLWTGATRQGYSALTFNRRTDYGHRVVYRFFKGDFQGVLDHLCHTRSCVNPEHLEAVTQCENIRRILPERRLNRVAGGSKKIYEGVIRSRDHCFRGHLLSEDNIVKQKRGGRTCKTCRDASRLAAERRRKFERTGIPVRPFVERIHCPQGHLWTPETSYYDNRGFRLCKICLYARSMAWAKRNPDRKSEYFKRWYAKTRGKEVML